jgi:putative ABC transport system permease protein
MPLLMFAVSVAIASGVVSSAVPAWVCARSRLSDVLARTASATSTGSNRWVSGWFVAFEVAVTVTLLIATGLLVASLAQLHRVDTGLHIPNALMADVRPTRAAYRGARERDRYFRQVITDLRSALDPLPVTAASMMPLGHFTRVSVSVGATSAPATVRGLTVADRYFETLGIALRAGRDFSATDDEDAAHVAIIDETAARLWTNGSPLGQQTTIGVGARQVSAEVIGVVADVRETLAREPSAHFYLPLRQNPPFSMAIIVRTDQPYGMLSIVQGTLRSIDPNLPLANVTTLAEQRAHQTAMRRFLMVILLIFAVVAVWLTVIGVVGVVAYAIHRRLPEIGVRRALGASDRSVVVLIMRQALVPTLVGLLVGSAAAANTSKLLRSSLYQVSPVEPSLYLAIGLLFGLVALLASYLPARAATHIDPVISLRAE